MPNLSPELKTSFLREIPPGIIKGIGPQEYLSRELNKRPLKTFPRKIPPIRRNS